MPRRGKQLTGNNGPVNIETALKEAMTIDGALGVALVDWDSGARQSSLKQAEAELEF